MGLIGAAGSGASAGEGKKASDSQQALEKQQLAIQQQQLGLEQAANARSVRAFTPAFNYWNSLLQGGQAARVAVGPIAGDITQQTSATGNQILNTLPAGGERNLARAQNLISGGTNLARLYAGVQPAAATALGNLASFTGSQAVGFGGTTNTNIGAAASTLASQQAQLAQGAQGFGNILYRALQKQPGGGGGGGYTTTMPGVDTSGWNPFSGVLPSGTGTTPTVDPNIINALGGQ